MKLMDRGFKNKGAGVSYRMPTVTSGILAPSSAPIAIGDLYFDTVAVKLYWANGTVSSSNWVQLTIL